MNPESKPVREPLTAELQKSVYLAQQMGYDYIARERKWALRNMTHEQNMLAVAALFGFPVGPGIDRPCGLVEFQDLMRVLRR
ncbi:MAG: hypothetical protein JNK75_14325 [Betaproteobacteria bacterium]|nr:hypothetical protein [Betaproteobacteria bacterium]